MENASKALLIAAAILVAVVILTLLLVAYGNLSEYYQSKQNAAYIEDLAEYNQIFAGYNRDNIRGNEILSLMNRVIDYNERQSYDDEKKYPRINVTININDTSEFIYTTNVTPDISSIGNPIRPSVTNINGSDNNLISITQVENNWVNGNNLNFKYTADSLQKLSANISNIFVQETHTPNATTTLYHTEVSNLLKRYSILKSIFKLDVENDKNNTSLLNNKTVKIKYNNETGILSNDSISKNSMKEIKQATYQYYQLTQFKRAYFNCTAMEHDSATGRINKMAFEFTGFN